MFFAGLFVSSQTTECRIDVKTYPQRDVQETIIFTLSPDVHFYLFVVMHNEMFPGSFAGHFFLWFSRHVYELNERMSFSDLGDIFISHFYIYAMACIGK